MSKQSFLKEALYRKSFSGTELENLSDKHKINISTAIDILVKNKFEREILEEIYSIKDNK